MKEVGIARPTSSAERRPSEPTISTMTRKMAVRIED